MSRVRGSKKCWARLRTRNWRGDSRRARRRWSLCGGSFQFRAADKRVRSTRDNLTRSGNGCEIVGTSKGRCPALPLWRTDAEVIVEKIYTRGAGGIQRTECVRPAEVFRWWNAIKELHISQEWL